MTDRPEDPNTDALQQLWQGQERETPAMTAKAVRMLVRNDRDHMRQQILFGLVLVGVEVVAFGSMLRVAPNALMRAGEIIILLGLAWMTWRMLQRWPRRVPDADATTQSLIAFQRQALMRRRGGYGWLLASSAPVIIGAIMTAVGGYLVHPGAPISRLAPFFSLLAFWFVAGWFVNRRGSRKLQEQIDDLDEIGRG